MSASAVPAYTRAIRRRLIGGIALILAVTGVTLGSTAIHLIGASEAIGREADRFQRLDQGVASLTEAVDAQAQALNEYRLSQSDSVLADHERAVERERTAEIAILGAAVEDAEALERAMATFAAADAWRTRWVEPTMMLLRAGGPVPEPNAIGIELRKDVITTLDALRSLASSRQAIIQERIEVMARTTALMLVGTILVALTVVPAVGLWLVRTIGAPLDRLIATAERVRRGEPAQFQAVGDDEMAMLARTLEKLRIDLAERYDHAMDDAAQAETFNRLGELITFAASEHELVDAAVATVQRLVPSNAGDLVLLNPSLDRLVVAAAWGPEAASLGSMVDIDRPDACPGVRRGSVYHAPDVTDPMVLRCPAHRVATGSVLCVPLLTTGQTVGVIHLERPTVDGFDMQAQRLASRVAEQVALALANARMMRTMEGLAMRDPLTRLHNARFFDPLLERELALAARNGKPLALLMVDLDHFKEFNDTHGHPAGDEALKAFAATVLGAVRESDTVARYGGEEFVVALPGADTDGGCAAAESIRHAVEQLIVEIGPGRYARVTVSVGVVSTATHGYDRMVLMRTADQALYRAKRAGRNRVEAAEPAEIPVSPPTRTRAKRRPANPDPADVSARDLKVVPGA